MLSNTGSRSSAGPFNPSTLAGSALGQKTESSYDVRVQNWLDQLTSLPQSVSAQVQDFLLKMSRGHAQDPALAQTVFNTLIQHEAYELFVATFLAHQDMERTQAEAAHQPYTSTLCLQLPDGWTPRAPAALVAAFEKVQVDRLEVLRAPAPQAPDQGGASTQTPVCADVCEAILKLLQSGTRELCLQVALADAKAVGRAIGASQQLVSLSLGDPLGFGPMDAEEQANHHLVMLLGALKSSSLRQLALHGREPVAVLVQFMATRQTSNLPWTSLTLACRNNGADVNTLLLDLPRILRWLPDLRALEIATRGLDAVTRAKTLNLFWGASAIGTLRRFVCDLGPLRISASATMRALQDRDPQLLKFQGEIFPEALRRPTFQLEEWVMTGFPWSAEGLGGVSAGLAENKTLHRVDLSDGCLESDAMAQLTLAVRANGILQSFKVPQDPDNYYLNRPNQGIAESPTSALFIPGDMQAALDSRGPRDTPLVAGRTTTTTTTTVTATTTTSSTLARTSDTPTLHGGPAQ